MTKIIIAGAKGKMGQALQRVAAKMPELKLCGTVDRGQDFAAVAQNCDVVIDFTDPEATIPFAHICAKQGKAMVIGTTGFSEAERHEVEAFAKQIPIVLSANFSTGVNTLFWLAAKAEAILGPGYDLDIVEMHHNQKKDKHSGTAQTLARILAKGRKKEPSAINIHSLRGGDVVGDHTVVFSTTGERVELVHKASSRDTFASGALRAAQWIAGKPAGLYDMQDVLGLK